MLKQLKQVKPVDFVLMTLILLSCGATIVLTLENEALKKTLSGFESPGSDTSVIGSIASPIRVTNLDGEAETLSFDRRTVPTLLFIFTTTCPHCEGSFPTWRSGSVILDSSECDMVGISLDAREPTIRFRNRQDIPFRVVLNVDSALSTDFHIGGVPQTFVISPSGVITHVWRGRFDMAMLPDLIRAVRDSSHHRS